MRNRISGLATGQGSNNFECFFPDDTGIRTHVHQNTELPCEATKWCCRLPAFEPAVNGVEYRHIIGKKGSKVLVFPDTSLVQQREVGPGDPRHEIGAINQRTRKHTYVGENIAGSTELLGYSVTCLSFSS